MKRNLLYLLLIISVPVCLYIGALAQEGSGDGKDTTSIEKRDGDKTDSSSGKEGTTAIEKKIDAGTRTDDAKKEAKKKAERKKREVKKQAEKKPEEKKKETVKKEEIPEDNLDRESGDSLLMLDHEGVKYNRIPDITIKAEEPGQDLVRIPDDKITGASKDEKKSEGIFGRKTSTIAGWAIVICIFIIFAIYSKTRTRRSRRKGSRIITKR